MPQKHWTLQKFFLIGAAFIITTGLLFGGEALAEYFFKDSPLQQWAEAVPEIKEFTLLGKGRSSVSGWKRPMISVIPSSLFSGNPGKEKRGD